MGTVPKVERVAIPADRVRLEARLIQVMGSPRRGRYDRLGDFLCEPGTCDYPEIRCVILAEMTRCGDADQQRRTLRIADDSEHCEVTGGDHCECCPVQRVRRRSAG